MGFFKTTPDDIKKAIKKAKADPSSPSKREKLNSSIESYSKKIVPPNVEIANYWREVASIYEQHDSEAKTYALGRLAKWRSTEPAQNPGQSVVSPGQNSNVSIAAAAPVAAPAPAPVPVSAPAHIPVPVSTSDDITSSITDLVVVASVLNVSSDNDDGEPILKPYIFQSVEAPPVPSKALMTYPFTVADIDNTDELAHHIAVLTPLISSDKLNDEEKRLNNDTRVIKDMELNLLKVAAATVVDEYCTKEDISEKDTEEVLDLASVLEKGDYLKVLDKLVKQLENSASLKVKSVQALGQFLKNAIQSQNLGPEDLTPVVELVTGRLKSIQGPVDLETISALSSILDSIVDSQIGIKDEEELSNSLNALMSSGSSLDVDFHLRYALQASKSINNDQVLFKNVFKRDGKVVRAASGIVAATEDLDLDEFKKSLGQDSWYLSLRGLDTLTENYRFEDFEDVVRTTDCRKQDIFQWGVCERLYDIAISSTIGDDTCIAALDFLRELFIDQDTWETNGNPKIKEHTYKTISRVEKTRCSIRKNDYVSDYAHSLLEESLFEEYKSLSVTIPETLEPETNPNELAEARNSLINIAQDRMEKDVDIKLRQVNKDRLTDFKEYIYINPKAKPNLNASVEDEFDLMDKVQEFLKGEKRMFLILGDSGGGKSFFIEHLEHDLWWLLRKGEFKRIPLYIRLPTIDNPIENLVYKRLKTLKFDDEQIEKLKAEREFLFICDGYDEAVLEKNLYNENKINTEGGWKGQMMVTCRTDHNPALYKPRFVPSENDTLKIDEFQEAVIIPFSKEDVHKYVKSFIKNQDPDDIEPKDTENQDDEDVRKLWREEKYMDAIDNVPDLLDMIKNPFLLKIALDALPGLISKKTVFTTARITRVQLYDEFFLSWINKARDELGSKQSEKEKWTALYSEVVKTGYIKSCLDYLREYSTALYENQNGKPVVELRTWRADGKKWLKEYLDDKDMFMTVIPAGIKDGMYDFVHKSVMEYGLSLSVHLPNVEETDTLSDRQRKTYTYDKLFEDPPEIISTDKDLQALIETPLGRINLVDKKSVLEFLAERVRYEPKFEQNLWDIVMKSKTANDSEVALLRAASNSITILVKAGVQFNGKDLKGIKIKDADLSFGVFDSAELHGADLRGVKLQNVWLRQATLDGGKMEDVKFGELPYIKAESLVKCCAYETSGVLFGIGLESGEIGLFETSSWKRQRVLKGHIGPVGCIAFSPNLAKRLLASGSYDKTIRVWDLDTGNSVNLLKGHEGEVTSIVYSPDGGSVVSGSYDKSVRLWDLKGDKQKHAFIGHKGVITAIMHSPTKPQVASGSFDSGVYVWDTDSGEVLFNLEGKHKEKITVVMFSRDGRHLATGSDDKTIKVWDTNNGDLVYEITEHTGGVSSIVYSPVKDEFASASNDRTIRIWKMEDGSAVKTLKGHDGEVTSIIYSKDGSVIASGSDDKTVRLWDVETGKSFQTLQGHNLRITSLVYCAEINQIASGSWDKTVRLWNLAANNLPTNTRGHVRKVTTVTYSPQGSAVASGSEDHSIRLWKNKTGKSVHTLKKHKAKVTCLAFSRDERQFASGSEDGTVEIWNVEDGINIKCLKGHKKEVNSIAYSSHKGQLATGSWDSTVALWDTKTLEKTHVLRGHTLPITTVIYSPVDGTIATASWDGSVRLWNDGGIFDQEEDENTIEKDGDGARVVKEVRELRALKGHKRWVNSIVFSNDGQKIVSGSHDNTVRIWNTYAANSDNPETNSEDSLFTLTGHTLGVISVAFSIDGAQVASGSLDKTVRLWNALTGNIEYVLQGHTAMVSNVSYSPCGEIVASRSDDNSVKIWSTSTDQNLVTISSSNGGINGIAWDKRNGVNGHYLATGCEDKSVRRWNIRDHSDKDKDTTDFKAHLCWSSSHELLTVNEVSLDDHHGLSRLNWMLLSQRGAGLTQSVPPEQ